MCVVRSSVACLVFFNQKPAYDMPLRLVGSEMCIRDLVASGLWIRQDVLLRVLAILGEG